MQSLVWVCAFGLGHLCYWFVFSKAKRCRRAEVGSGLQVAWQSLVHQNPSQSTAECVQWETCWVSLCTLGQCASVPSADRAHSWRYSRFCRQAPPQLVSIELSQLRGVRAASGVSLQCAQEPAATCIQTAGRTTSPGFPGPCFPSQLQADSKGTSINVWLNTITICFPENRSLTWATIPYTISTPHV